MENLYGYPNPRTNDPSRQRQPKLAAQRPAHHRYAHCQHCWPALSRDADPHRHQPGHLRLRRGARRREQDLCPDAQEPADRRKPLQRRQGLPQDQAVRPPRTAGGRRLRRGDGADGFGGQGLRRARLHAGGRQVPRQGALLLRHRLHPRRQEDGPAPQAPHGGTASNSSRWMWASACCARCPTR